MMLRFAAFNASCNKAIPDALVRPRIVAAAVALAVATQASLPTSAVDNVTLHFSTQVMQPMHSEVSRLNEELIFDARQACDYTRMFWMVRYNAAHPVIRAAFDSGFSFFDNLNGVAFAASPEAVEFFNKYKNDILALGAEVTSLLCEIAQPG